jgi:hypothetical protein
MTDKQMPLSPRLHNTHAHACHSQDMCTPNVQMKIVPFQPDTPVKDLSEKEYRQLQKTNKCRVS